MTKTGYRCALAALGALALTAFVPAEAEPFWLLEGDLKHNAGARSDLNGNGLGCWLKLTNDTVGASCAPVRVYDIRRKTTGGTDLVKYNEGNSVEMFPGCRYGEAVVDFTLPIRGADGTSYTLVGLANQAFAGNYFLGKAILTNSLEYLGHRAFQNCYYLKRITFPDPATWEPEYIGKNADGGRVFEACSRLEGDILWPDILAEVPQYTFSGCGALKGFCGKGVTTYQGGAFHSTPTDFRLEMSEAATISFPGEAINRDGGNIAVVWHETPPSTGDYFSKNGNSFMKRSGTSRVHYIPYDATQEDGIPARWAAYKTAFEAETSGNSLTFPVYDSATGTQTAGSWYINGRASNADKVRFWFPEETAALLMK
ncbi:MAG: leucine-rich repeat protein [Kiritimatiellae bacterium]|nr:leucine-rich repeat protein [Kiritimatiellia bacterium]